MKHNSMVLYMAISNSAFALIGLVMNSKSHSIYYIATIISLCTYFLLENRDSDQSDQSDN